MTTSRLSLYNGALLLCGERELATLDENREPRRLLDLAWNAGAVDFALGASQWKFATRTVELSPDTWVTPSFGYQLAYAKPTDHVRTIKLCLDEYFKVPLLQYSQEQNYWFSDAEPIYISYVSNDAVYGGDMSLWPVEFIEFVEAKLATKIVLRLTQDEKVQNKVFGLMGKLEKQAASSDAMEGPTEFLPEGSWARARRSSARRDGGSRRSLP